MVVSRRLTNAEEIEVANALWQNIDPVEQNRSGVVSPSDWVFMLLPEIEQGQAEQSFRNKWFSASSREPVTGDAHSMEVLGQVGSAIVSLRLRGIEFRLSDEESETIGQHILQLVRRYSQGRVTTILSDRQSVIRNLGATGATISISDHLANELFNETKNLVEAESAPSGTSFSEFLQFSYSFGTAVGYGVMLCLVKALPDQVNTIETWLATALASSDENKVRGAMKTVRDWISMPTDLGLTTLPENSLREIGAIIASRRKDALAGALWCAVSIFRYGTEQQREAIALFAQHGLFYLAEEMRYEIHPFDVDVPTIRLLCVQLAVSMAANGYKSLAGVEMWISIGRNDPFPEVRNEVISLDSDDEDETEENGHEID